MPTPTFAVTPNMRYLWGALTSDTITKMSGGRIPKMTPQQAAGLLGSWIVETGRQGLDKLDVVERGAAAGRGLSQYTGMRRIAYDNARAKAIKQGIDPNSPQWQLQYFVEEYTGKHDPAPGQSLIGYTRVFESAPKAGTPAKYATYYTGSAAAGKGYFRPGIPHTEKRAQLAEQVYRALTQQQQQELQIPQQQNQPATGQRPFWEALGIPPIRWNSSQLEIPQGPHTPLPTPGWSPREIKPPGNPNYRPPAQYERILPDGRMVPFA